MLSPEYAAWRQIRRRCHNPNDSAFQFYGAKGILVCERWRNSFPNFLADMGLRPPNKTSIDRIDNAKGYEPGNCRWADAKEQSRNRSLNRKLTFRGETLCLSEWAERLKITSGSLAERIERWGEERALSEPRGTRVRGVVRNGAKLDAEKIRAMRNARSAGLGFREIARDFGISVRTAWLAVTGNSWKGVE